MAEVARAIRVASLSLLSRPVGGVGEKSRFSALGGSPRPPARGIVPVVTCEACDAEHQFSGSRSLMHWLSEASGDAP